MNGHVEVVKVLLKDVRVNLKDTKNGFAPLLVACLNGHVEVVKVLLADERVDLNKGDNYGYTALHHACRVEKNITIIESLMKHGANPFIESRYNISPFDIDTNTTTQHIMKIYGYMYGHIRENLNILDLHNEECQKLRPEAVQLRENPEMLGIFASKIFHQNAPRTVRLDILTAKNINLLVIKFKIYLRIPTYLQLIALIN
jgi:hypothetical protein